MKHLKIWLTSLVLSTFAFSGNFGKGVVTLPSAKSDHVTIRLMFRAGSVNDPAGKEGLTSLTASLITDGGNEQYSKQEIDDILYPMAVGFGVSVDKEVTVFTTTIHRDNLDKAYSIFRDLILKPRFDGQDFERVRKNTVKFVNEVPSNNDEVFSKRVLDTIMFAGHPYEHLVQGKASSLETMTREDVMNHYKKIFTRKNLMIGLAGGYSEAFKKTIRADMDKLPEGSDNRVELPKVPMPNGIKAKVVSKNAFGTAIFMGYPIEIDRADDDFAALLLVASYLGEHRKSYGQLYQKMRSDRSLNYGDYSYVEWYQSGHAVQLPLTGFVRSQNFFSMWIRPVQIADQFKGIEGLEPPALGNGHFVIRQAIRELDHLLKEGMSEDDFQRVRKFMKGYLNLYIQSAGSRLGFLMDSRMHGRTDYINDMRKLMDKLDRNKVNQVMRKHLQAKNFYLSVITAESEAGPLAESLKTNGSAPIVYKPIVKNGLSEDTLKEDKEIDNYKLNVTEAKVIKGETFFK